MTFQRQKQSAARFRLPMQVAILPILVTICAAILAGGEFFSTRVQWKSGENRLQIGATASVPPFEVPVIGAIAGDNAWTKADIVQKRIQRMTQFRSIVASPYKPAPALFAGIKDDAPWFSEEWFYVRGKGSAIVPGVPVEARAILNPLMLVNPEFWGLSIWSKNIEWDPRKVTAEALAEPGFPLYPRVQRLLWVPQSSSAEAFYDMSGYLRQVNAVTIRPPDAGRMDFGVSAWNAVDFGFTHIAFLADESKGVRSAKPLKRSPIVDGLMYFPKLCGNTEGCNHRFNPIPALDTLVVERLPSRAVFGLWQHREGEGEPGGEPAFKYAVNLR